MTYSDTITAQALKALSPEERASVKTAEQVLTHIEEGIMDDSVTVQGYGMGGYPVAYTTSLSDALAQVAELQNATVEEEKPEEDPFPGLGKKIEREKQEASQVKPIPVQQSYLLPLPGSSVPPLPADDFGRFGLGFLTTPPTPPAKTVKLRLYGPMKFSTSLDCHTFNVTDQVVVLVTDKRAKPEVIDLSFDDPEMRVELQMGENQSIEVYPPVPQVLTYDIGVLRHFVFIRKHE